ncbi:MAG: hypothetical protein RR054_03915 [Clostridia bacterium]
MIEQLLKYQTLDLSQRAVKNEINSTDEFKKTHQAKRFLKDAEDALKKMDTQVNELNKVLNNLSIEFEKNNKIIGEYEMQVDNSEDIGELNYLEKKASQLTKLIESQEKDISLIVIEVEQLMQSFEDFRAKVPAYKKLYKENREKYDAIVIQRSRELDAIKNEMTALEHKIHPKLLDAYKKLSAEAIMPAAVPLKGSDRCSGCNMNIPLGTVSKIDEFGFIVCENCRRIVYKT